MLDGERSASGFGTLAAVCEHRRVEMNLSLRKATQSDLEYIVGLKERTMREDLERLGVWHPARSRARVAAAFGVDQTRIIEGQDGAVGCVSIRPAPDALWVELFYIEPWAQ
ncbi:hypothetical protein ACC691_36520, partial [Rhizobium johnstonii]